MLGVPQVEKGRAGITPTARRWSKDGIWVAVLLQKTVDVQVMCLPLIQQQRKILKYYFVGFPSSCLALALGGTPPRDYLPSFATLNAQSTCHGLHRVDSFVQQSRKVTTVVYCTLYGS